MLIFYGIAFGSYINNKMNKVVKDTLSKEKYNKYDLEKWAKENGIKNISRMNKTQLEDAIANHVKYYNKCKCKPLAHPMNMNNVCMTCNLPRSPYVINDSYELINRTFGDLLF